MYTYKTAVVILNYNGRNFLDQFLPSVIAYSADAAVIVADNASTDESILLLKSKFPKVQIIQLEDNTGYAGGYHAALQQIDAEYFVLLNSDVEVTPSWLSTLIDAMDTEQQVAACQPKIKSYHQKASFEYAGACGGWIDRLGFPFSRGRILDFCEVDQGQYDTAQKIFWATGACLVIRSRLYDAVGGLDPFFFAHMEEIDLCWRLQRAGFEIKCYPQSSVYHVGGGTLPKGNSRKVYYNFRNNLIMLSKNLSAKEKIWILPTRICLDAVFAWKSLLTGHSADFVAVLKAHLHFFFWLKSKRKKILLPNKALPLLAGYYPGLIAWQYFIKRRKTFSEIIPHKMDI